MIGLMDKQEIILLHFRDGKSQWDIYRETGIDRKTTASLLLLVCR